MTDVKTMLVLGEVEPNHCKVPQSELRSQGIELQARRVTDMELFLEDEHLAAIYATPEQRRQIAELMEEDTIASLCEAGQIEVTLAVQHIATFGTIGAVIMDEPTWINWSRWLTFKDAFEQLTESYDRWVVRSDGTVECVN